MAEYAGIFVAVFTGVEHIDAYFTTKPKQLLRVANWQANKLRVSSDVCGTVVTCMVTNVVMWSVRRNRVTVPLMAYL